MHFVPCSCETDRGGGGGGFLCTAALQGARRAASRRPGVHRFPVSGKRTTAMAPLSEPENLSQLWLDQRFPFNVIAYLRDHGGNLWGYGVLGAMAGILGESNAQVSDRRVFVWGGDANCGP